MLFNVRLKKERTSLGRATPCAPSEPERGIHCIHAASPGRVRQTLDISDALGISTVKRRERRAPAVERGIHAASPCEIRKSLDKSGVLGSRRTLKRRKRRAPVLERGIHAASPALSPRTLKRHGLGTFIGAAPSSFGGSYDLLFDIAENLDSAFHNGQPSAFAQAHLRRP